MENNRRETVDFGSFAFDIKENAYAQNSTQVLAELYHNGYKKAIA